MSRSTDNQDQEFYNWTNPTRSATDEEFEQMISEAESSPLMSESEAKAYTYELIEKWKTNQY